MPDYNEYAQRVVNAIEKYGEKIEKINLKYRVSSYDPIKGETYKYRRYRNWMVFIRPTDKKDWEQLPDGLKLRDVRKVYFTKPFPKKELIIERLKDGKEYEIIVPPEDNYFEDKNFYYKCFIAVKEISNDPD